MITMFKNRKIKVKFYGVNLKFKLYYYAVLLILLALLITLSMYIDVEYFKKFKWSIVIIFLISVFFEYFTSEFSLSESQRIKAKLKKVRSEERRVGKERRWRCAPRPQREKQEAPATTEVQNTSMQG